MRATTDASNLSILPPVAYCGEVWYHDLVIHSPTTQRLPLSLILIGLIVALTLSSCAAASADSVPAAPVRVQEAYFYKPPRDGTTAQDLAARAALIILTRTDEPFRDAVRDAGYSGIILQYMLAAEVSGPIDAVRADAPCNAQHRPWRNQAAFRVGEFCALIHPNDDWFLHNDRGERLYTNWPGHTGYFYHMNPASPGWRAFLSARLRQALNGDAQEPALGYDGVFLDNVALSLWKLRAQVSNSDGVVREFQTDDAYRAAWIGLLRDLSDALRPAWPVWANLIADPSPSQGWNDYLPYLDGVMVEAFATGWRNNVPPDQWERGLTQAEETLKQGKGYLAVVQARDQALLPFALASYLLIADGRHAFFRYAEKGDYAIYPHYPLLDIDLGAPEGPRYRQNDGAWRRDFAHGYVVAYPDTKTARIVLNGETLTE
jgi:hypothetical protein